MNELEAKQKLTVLQGKLDDLIEQQKTIDEQIETFKYLVLKSGLDKIETDYHIINVIRGAKDTKKDNERIKKTNVYIVNGQTGELDEANLYDYLQTFNIKSIKKDYVSIKEKK